jgi:putative ABC transport system substrate-binding protein
VRAAPLAVEGQQPGSVARIGYLAFSPLESPETRVALDAFQQGLRERDYVEDQNIVIEYRSADGKIERFPGLATELARLKVDLIVAPNTPAARAAQQATTTIPIVAPAMSDPVGDGLVASLARPGGNITGLTFLGPELPSSRFRACCSTTSEGASSISPPSAGCPRCSTPGSRWRSVAS